MDAKRIEEIEEQIADLKARWPAHSVKPEMFMQLESLEEELVKARIINKNERGGDPGKNNPHHLDRPDRERELRPKELLKKVAGLDRGMTCIDFGCGPGLFALPMADLVGKCGMVYAIDENPEMLEYIKSKNPPSNLELINAYVQNTGLNDRIADICFLSSILHEVRPPLNLINEASRLLKPEGTMVIVEWKADRGNPGPPQEERISREGLIMLLRRSNFKLNGYQDWSENYYVATAKIETAV